MYTYMHMYRSVIATHSELCLKVEFRRGEGDCVGIPGTEHTQHHKAYQCHSTLREGDEQGRPQLDVQNMVNRVN